MIEVTTELAHQIELAEATNSANSAEYRARQDLGSGAVAEVGGGLAIFAGVGSPITQAFGLGLTGEITTGDFEELEDFFRSRGADVNVETCPLADLSLTHGFCERGYRPVEFSNVFARDLALPLDLRPPKPGVTVRPLAEGEEDLWTEITTRGFCEGKLDEFLCDVMRGFIGHEKVEPYFGLVDGEPAAGASMGVHGEIAVVNGAATLPQFRRRGLQTALLRVRLERAAAAGARLAMVATEVATGSQRNVERAGFRVLYTRTKWCRCRAQ